MDSKLPLEPLPARSAVLTKAYIRAAEQLGLSGQQAAKVVGASPATFSRMRKGGAMLVEGAKGFELAALFIRVYRSLIAIVGQDNEKAQKWLRVPNRHLLGTPMDLIQTVEGLTDVIRYLDALRSRI